MTGWGEGERPVSGTDSQPESVGLERRGFPGGAQAKALWPGAVVRLEIQLTSSRCARRARLPVASSATWKSCRSPELTAVEWRQAKDEGRARASGICGAPVSHGTRSKWLLSQPRTTPRGPELPLGPSPAGFTSPCFPDYKLDQKISKALLALRSHDMDKPARGVSFQASFTFLPLWLTNLGFGNCLNFFFLPAIVCMHA